MSDESDKWKIQRRHQERAGRVREDLLEDRMVGPSLEGKKRFERKE